MHGDQPYIVFSSENLKRLRGFVCAQSHIKCSCNSKNVNNRIKLLGSISANNFIQIVKQMLGSTTS